MSPLAVTLGNQPETLPLVSGNLRAIMAMALVLGLVSLLAWLLRRGTLRLPGAKTRTLMTIDSAVSLGERRSLVIVSVEGRRLLIGLTPAQVSLVTELAPAPAAATADFPDALDRRLASPEARA